jgi:hypothetical protein
MKLLMALTLIFLGLMLQHQTQADVLAEVIVVSTSPEWGSLEKIRVLCDDPGDPSFWGGCGQFMAIQDDLHGWRRNWSSRDFLNHGGGPYKNFEACDWITNWSGRGLLKVVLSDGWLLIGKQRVRPDEAVSYLETYNYYVGEVHCLQTLPDQSVVMHEGAFARHFQIGQTSWLTDQDLLDIANGPSLNVYQEPYRSAYQAVVGGLEEAQGYAANPHPLGTPPCLRYAWENRHAIFSTIADGTMVDPHSRDQFFWNVTQLCEWYTLFACWRDFEEMEANWQILQEWPGAPMFYSLEIRHALDWIYEQTRDNDPYHIFQDWVTGLKPTTHGQLKRALLEGDQNVLPTLGNVDR